MQQDASSCSDYSAFGILIPVNTPKQKRPRTYARNRATTRTGSEKVFEKDSTYFLKLVIFALMGTLWIKFGAPVTWLGITIASIPLGFFVGILLVSRFEKYQSDRKIWYAILLVVTIICNFLPAGIVI
jgi:hypothetical protein